MPNARSTSLRQRASRESLIFLAFVGLTLLMTWPWVRYMRDAAPDTGDSYLNAWILWWDYHQTFRDPANLFQAPLFYPARYALAFSENNYGIALFCFPLFAVGLRPVTVHGFATLLGFTLCAYGAFRLARTLTGSDGAAWVAGIAFGYPLYRYHQLAHLNYLFAGWIPLLFEAVVLFVRRRTWGRAVWLGVAFLMNTLTCIHWFVLTTVPLALTAAVLLTRYRLWRDVKLRQRGAVCLATAMLLLLPFLLPYQRTAFLYNFIRTPSDVAHYSAHLRDWLAADWRNHLWRGFGTPPDTGERALFPGLLSPLFTLAALALTLRGARRRNQANAPNTDARSGATPPPPHTAADEASAAARQEAMREGATHEEALRQEALHEETRVSHEETAASTRLATTAADATTQENRDAGYFDTLYIGLICLVTGFFGSLGMNFIFHRMLYYYVPFFKSIRVPARWAMIAVLGLSLLAALGVRKIVEALARRRPVFRSLNARRILYGFVCLLFLFELRAAPLELVRGNVEPDEITLRLRQTPMRGGIVHLPAGLYAPLHLYTLRQADHMRPLVTAISGFSPNFIQELEGLTSSRRIPERFFELIESLPVSYLVVHTPSLLPETRTAIERMLTDGLANNRLRYVGRFGGETSGGDADLYAVVKTEPDVQSDVPPPASVRPRQLNAALADDPVILVSEFDTWSYPLYRLYKTAYGRAPRYSELIADAQATGGNIILQTSEWEERLAAKTRAFAEEFTRRKAFETAYARMSNEEYVARLFANTGIAAGDDDRVALVVALDEGAETRAGVLWKISAREDFIRKDYNAAYVLMHYFGYLRRNPDDPPDNNMEGYNFWLKEMEAAGRDRLTTAFMASGEYKEKAKGKTQD